jgi:hypothetical protein
MHVIILLEECDKEDTVEVTETAATTAAATSCFKRITH